MMKPMSRITRGLHGGRGILFPVLGLLVLQSGCLGKPEIEDTWTRLDVFSPEQGADVPVGAGSTIVLEGEVVYRSILTGAIVAEIRVSDTVAPTQVDLGNTDSRVAVLEDVDRILQNSTSGGFGAVMFTGWDHLIQGVEITFDAEIPSPPPGGGVYLLFYLADAEEEELPTGEKILIIDPFDFRATEVLPIGVELNPTTG